MESTHYVNYMQGMLRMLVSLNDLKNQYKDIRQGEIRENQPNTSTKSITEETAVEQSKPQAIKRPRGPNLDRCGDDYFDLTFSVIKEKDPKQFFEHTRMTLNAYNVLYFLINEKLEKKSIRQAINPEYRLAITLTFLAQGVSIQSLAHDFKLGKETVRKIVLETCDVLWNTLSPFYVSEPTLMDFGEICQDFYSLSGLPNCIGALGGKHISIRCPSSSSSEYPKNKTMPGICLIASCDAKYRFTYVDVGMYGMQNEGIFRSSVLGKKIINKTLNIPQPQLSPLIDGLLPNFFVADAAFPLSENIMKPYPGQYLPIERQYFNQRINRATKVIENAFGLLASRWRILTTTLNLQPENAEKVVLACVALHNFIKLSEDSSQYCPPNFVDWEDCNYMEQPGEWRNIVPTSKFQSISPSNAAHRYGGQRSTEIRDKLCDYINSHNRQ